MSVLERALPALALAAMSMAMVPTAAAAAACDASIVPVTSTIRLDYDPFAFVPTSGRLAFDVESHDAAACAVDIVLLDAARVSIAQTGVGDTGVQVGFVAIAVDAAVATTATPGVWRLQLDPGARVRLTIDAAVRQDAVATAGEHTTDLMLELRDPGTATPRASPLPIHLTLLTPPRAQMNIVGAAATFGGGIRIAQVDFGVFQNNATRRVYLQVRANTAARLTIDSAHLGRLAREGGEVQEPGIAYSAILIDEPIDLTHHWEKVIDAPRSVAGTSLPLDLMLGVMGAHAEGVYSDVLTLELSAL